jgi:hypothetical protein
MPPTVIRALGLLLSLVYAAFIVWAYSARPRTMAEVRGGVAATVGVYTIDQTAFDEGLRFFRQDQFVEARRAFARADPAERHATTQFYVAYSYLRQGWGRFYHDDALYKLALEALAKAVAAAPDGQVRVADESLAIRTSDELAAELQRGLTRDASDLNPVRVFGSRP